MQTVTLHEHFRLSHQLSRQLYGTKTCGTWQQCLFLLLYPGMIMMQYLLDVIVGKVTFYGRITEIYFKSLGPVDGCLGKLLELIEYSVPNNAG